MSRSEKIALAAILTVATVVRLWHFPSYFPHFWDEALYVEEVDGLIQFFSVNVLSYALLKLGRVIIGVPSYPQIVTAFSGVVTVFGLFLMGRRLLSSERESTRLGLLMAACAAVMPYYVLYSRHALAAGFALCFFVFALLAYLGKLKHPPVKNRRSRMKYLRRSAIAAVLLAMAPACSFNLLLPTVVLFVLMEVVIWRVRSVKQKEYKGFQSLILTVIAGGLLFLLIPLGASAISGYTGWIGRAIALSEFHAQIKTMRLAFIFLYPVHLYYLAGSVLMVCLVAGAVFMFSKPRPNSEFAAGRAASVLLMLGFAVYVLFYGAFSHLQSARLYVLSLPFVAYAAAFAVMQLGRLLPRLGRIVVPAAVILLLGSMSRITIDYLSKSSCLPEASDEIMKHLKTEGMIYANAKTQAYHCTFHSPYNKARYFHLKSFLYAENVTLAADNPPVIVLQDGVDLVSTVASEDKADALYSIDTLKTRLTAYVTSVAKYADLIYAGSEDFFNSPYYYLEDVYSWRSYRYVCKLMPSCRDSAFVYLANPARYDKPSQSPQVTPPNGATDP